MTARYSSDYHEFQKALNNAKHIVAITGAGISAEAGIPTFRGADGLWRTYNATDLATPSAFEANPSLVWEFYHYRRELVFRTEPTKAHCALAKYEQEAKKCSKCLIIITQNVDGLHQKAGSQNVIELHGALNKVKCTKCGDVCVNTDSPICEALRGRGDPKALNKDLPSIEVSQLPRCKKCQGLLRPFIVWFGESLDPDILSATNSHIDCCDLCLLIGTSSNVYPAAAFAPTVAKKGAPVAEFNVTSAPFDKSFRFYFAGKCGTTVPKALGMENVIK